jgi:hypothetical protein
LAYRNGTAGKAAKKEEKKTMASTRIPEKRIAELIRDPRNLADKEIIEELGMSVAGTAYRRVRKIRTKLMREAGLPDGTDAVRVVEAERQSPSAPPTTTRTAAENGIAPEWMFDQKPPHREYLNQINRLFDVVLPSCTEFKIADQVLHLAENILEDGFTAEIAGMKGEKHEKR